MSEPSLIPVKVWHIPLLETDKTQALLHGLKARVETVLDTLQITVAPEDYRTLCERLFKAGFDFPSSMSGTDFEWGLGVALQIQQLESKRKVTVRTYCTYASPHVPTVSDLWGGVDWHEREAYDLVGIHFDGHADSVDGHPRRILLEDHWTIHPLQKRYNTRGYLISGWVAKPFPSPAPWEEGFQPFAAAVPAVHAAPKAVAAPVAAAAAPIVPAAPEATVSSQPVALTEPVTADPPKKVAKKWVPKGEAASSVPVPTPDVGAQHVAPVSAEAPADAVISSQPIEVVVSSPVAEAVAPTPAPPNPLVEARVARQVLSYEQEGVVAEGGGGSPEKPHNPKIKRWEPKS